MTSKPHKQQGFTLIEFIIVIVLLSIIAAASSQMLAQGLIAFLKAQDVTNANWQGWVAMERMTREIRAVRSANDISTSSAGEFNFVDMSGTTIDYKLSGGSLLRNTQVLADGVTSLTFTYYDKNGNPGPAVANITYVNIAFTVTQAHANYSINTSIFLRDLSS